MYQALYRKYRPTDFNSVVGQDPIIKTLKNSIINKTFSHAYMFFGPRGTGKTTVSKIFARNINCTNPKDGVACYECDNCKTSFSKNCVDIIEIDAASNNGVDEIRDLKNKVALVPSKLNYKVYIIDEVHMLSIGAFNALLKTLEEPPKHAVFILATTDPQKVPETIVSRCQCFSFKRISDNTIVEKLRRICNEEKIDIEDKVLENIAILSEGGLRDALGSLDKLVSFSSNKITLDDFTKVNGIISEEEIASFVKDVLMGNIKDVLVKLNEFNNCGKNLIQIMNQILNFIRNMLVDYFILDKKLDFSLDNLQKLANIINEKMFDIKKAGNTKIYIEMFLLSFMNKNPLNNQFKSTEDGCINSMEKIENNIKSLKEEVNIKNISEKIENREKEIDNLKEEDKSDEFNKISNDIGIENEHLMSRILNIEEIMKVRINNTLANANKNLLVMEKNNFNLLKDYTFDQKIGYIVCSLLDSKIRTVSPENIIISYEYDSNVKQNLQNIEMITDVYNKITNSNKNFAIISDDEWNKIKNDYINNLKNNIKYDILPEPEVILEESVNNDIIVSNTAVELFGDIVEID